MSDNWVAELETIELTPKQFDALLEYSTTLPTGKTLGKQWKRYIFAGPAKGEWVLCEYVEDPDPAYVAISNKRIVRLMDELEERAKSFAATRAGWTDGTQAFDHRFPNVEAFVAEFGEDALQPREQHYDIVVFEQYEEYTGQPPYECVWGWRKTMAEIEENIEDLATWHETWPLDIVMLVEVD